MAAASSASAASAASATSASSSAATAASSAATASAYMHCSTSPHPASGCSATSARLPLPSQVRPCGTAVERVVFWRRPLASLLTLLVWQLVCLSGGPGLLACVPLLLLVLLAHTHAAARAGPAILRPPGACSLLSSLLFALYWLLRF